MLHFTDQMQTIPTFCSIASKLHAWVIRYELPVGYNGPLNGAVIEPSYATILPEVSFFIRESISGYTITPCVGYFTSPAIDTR